MIIQYRKGEIVRRLIKNIYVVSVIAKINIVIFTFIGTIILNRYLGPTLKGEYSYIINYVSIFSLILTFSITKALPYYSKKYGKEIENQFVNFIYLQTVIFILVALIINYFLKSDTILIIMLFSIVSQFYQQISFIAMIKNLNLKNILSLINIFLYTILLILLFFVVTDNKLEVILYAYLFKIILETILNVWKYKIFPNNSGIDIGKFKEIIIFCFFPTISTLLITFNYKVDIIILELFEDFSELGLYSIGVTLAGMLWILPDAFKDVLFNKTAKDDSIKDIVFSIKFNIHASIIVLLGFLLVGESFIRIVYGKEFSGANTVVLILFIGNIPMIFFKMINTLYIAIGKQKMAMFILTIAVIINIISNFIFIPRYSIEGAALSSVISYSICGIVFLYSFAKTYDIKVKEFLLYNDSELTKFKMLFGGKR